MPERQELSHTLFTILGQALEKSDTTTISVTLEKTVELAKMLACLNFMMMLHDPEATFIICMRGG